MSPSHWPFVPVVETTLDTGHCEIRVTTVYLPQVFVGTHSSTCRKGSGELGELHADCPGRNSNWGPRILS